MYTGKYCEKCDKLGFEKCNCHTPKHWLCMNGWEGFTKEPVEIVGETPKRYRVKLLKDCRLPGRNRRGERGDIVLVPKYAVTDNKTPQ